MLATSQLLIVFYFATSLHLVWKLTRDDNINFFHNDRTKDADWWGVPLIDWEKVGEASSAMRQIYKTTGIIASKVTHDRAHAIQYGGAEGLAPYQIHSLSKHMTEKYFRSYASEADKEVRLWTQNFLNSISIL